MAEKADTVIPNGKARLDTDERFQKKRLGVHRVVGLACMERLAKQRKCFRKVGWFAVPW